MKISVVVPVYNVERYVELCVRSIMEQTFKDIEIICVNDGSTDNSLEILHKLAEEDNRIKVLTKNNSGYGHTMNVGLDNACGDYISIVESDDFIETNMLSELYNKAKNLNLDVIKSNFNFYTDLSCKFFENLKGIPYDKLLSQNEIRLLVDRGPSIWSALYKREFLYENNIRFNETKGASFQDTSFYMKVLSVVDKICVVKDAYLNYRHDNADSSTHSGTKMFCIIDEYHAINDYFKTNNQVDEKIRNTINYFEFFTYLNRFDNLDMPYKYAFALKVSEELQGRNLQMYTDASNFNDEDLRCFLMMRNEPQEFLKERIEYKDERLGPIGLPQFCINWKVCIDGLIKNLELNENVYIYGTGKYAKEMYSFLKRLQMEEVVKGFIVTNLVGNSSLMDSKEVFQLDLLTEKKDILVLVSVSDQYQFEILKDLKKLEYSNIISCNSDFIKSIRIYQENILSEVEES